MPLSPLVSEYLATLNHPLIEEIQKVRILVIKAVPDLTENIKWNGPNYACQGKDRITIKIQPPKVVQVIFHCGAKASAISPKELVMDLDKLLDWKSADRAVITFKNHALIDQHSEAFVAIVKSWIKATCG